MWRNAHLYIGLVILIALVAFFVMRVRGAGGVTPVATVSEGYQLAKAWCASCHAIELHAVEFPGQPPSFEAVANQPGVTPLALKVFLRTSHKDMPNLIVQPNEAEALVGYILSLKTN